MIPVATAPAQPAAYAARIQSFSVPSAGMAPSTYVVPATQPDAAIFSNPAAQSQMRAPNPFHASRVMQAGPIQPKFGFLPDAGIFSCGIPALCCCCCAVPLLLPLLLIFAH